MPRWNASSDGTELIVQTRTVGFAARLAYDVAVISRDASVELEFDPAAPAAAHASISVPCDSFEAHALTKPGSGKPAKLSAKDAAQIQEKTTTHLREALGSHVQIALTHVEELGKGVFRLRGSIAGDAVKVECDVKARISENMIEVDGQSKLSLSSLGVGPVRGPLGALTVADSVEIRLHSVLGPTESQFAGSH